MLEYGREREEKKGGDHKKALKETIKGNGPPIRVMIAIRICGTLAVVAGAVMVALSLI
jgi:hypothetical protein